MEHNRGTARPSSWCTLLHYLQHYFIWSWYDGQTSSGEDAKHSFSGGSRSKETKCCRLIMSPKKRISMIFWIRKKKQNKKHKRLTCKNILWPENNLKDDNISAMYKKYQYNISIYIFIYFLSSTPTKIYQRSSYWSIRGTLLKTV